MSDAYLGEIRLFAGNYAPEDWHLCDGSLLPINTYQALYSLIGTTYGGDGVTTFGLPDLRGRMIVGMGTSTTGIMYNRGQKAGAETVTVTVANMPAHTHMVSAASTAATSSSPNDAVWATADLTTFTASVPNTTLAPASVSTAPGGSQPHQNCQPSVALTYIIALQGIFPQQQ
ncbi:phage tail protein [Caenispirillum bisanense]|uniref:Microcystin-dependent protein n=1 Tax=Caenispirillum bisanense TaxID=414052 RepID=A0A286G5H8_9PROT|nr:tail fiber protein [Caenispirillum bisanense]SOD90745.1 Microcystin-dependent protein [Caenispirillum bisanense]